MNAASCKPNYYLSPGVISILLLGFSSGLPFLLLLSTLSVWLTQVGVSKTEIGLLTWITVPYALKFIWAPFLDRYHLPIICTLLGHRRGWLLVVQIGLMMGLIGLGHTHPQHHIMWTMIWGLWVGFCSATQDILIEAYRLEMLPARSSGYGASASVIGYRIGMLVSGAGALYWSTYHSWTSVYHGMAGFVLVGIITVLCSQETVKQDLEPLGEVSPSLSIGTWLKESFSQMLKQNSWLIFVFIVSFKAADSMLNTMSMPFLIEIGFSTYEIAYVAKTFGILAMILGGFIGGIVLNYYGVYHCLWLCVLMQVLSSVLFMVQAAVGHHVGWLFLTMGLEHLTSGISQVVLITYFSHLCYKHRSFLGSHFALLSSISSLARIGISNLAGWLADYCSWSLFYLLAIGLSVPALLLLSRYSGYFLALSSHNGLNKNHGAQIFTKAR